MLQKSRGGLGPLSCRAFCIIFIGSLYFNIFPTSKLLFFKQNIGVYSNGSKGEKSNEGVCLKSKIFWSLSFSIVLASTWKISQFSTLAKTTSNNSHPTTVDSSRPFLNTLSPFQQFLKKHSTLQKQLHEAQQIWQTTSASLQTDHDNLEKSDNTLTRLETLRRLQEQIIQASDIEKQLLLSFLKLVASNPQESVIVQRQAIQSAQTLLSEATEIQRMSFLASVSKTALALARQSKDQILQHALHHAELNLQQEETHQRPPQEPQSSINDYSLLPCPTPDQFVRLLEKAKYKEKMDYACDNSPNGKLAKILLLLSQIQIQQNVSEVVPADIFLDIKNPFDFFTERIDELKINFSEKGYTAANQVGKKIITLSGIFFALKPLKALNVLVHESRHSDKDDPGHLKCAVGDLPGTVGACDFDFSHEKEKAGAYAYGVYFDLAMAYNYPLSRADKEYLKDQALDRISTRFNHLNPRWAQFHDLIVGLDENHQITALHPFLAHTTVQFSTNHKIKDITFDDDSGGIFLLKDSGAPVAWRLERPEDPYFPKLIHSDFPILTAGKLFLPNDMSLMSYDTFLDHNNTLSYIDFDSEKLENAVRPFPLQAENFKVHQFFQANVKYSYLVSETGKLFRFKVWGNDQNTNLDPLFEHDRRWKMANPGVFRESLWGINQNGILEHYIAEEENYDTGGFTNTLPAGPQMENSSFQSSSPASAYSEGTTLRALLDENGLITVQNYQNPKSILLDLPKKLKNFTITRFIELRETLSGLHKRNISSDFQKNCSIEKIKIDPWLKKPMGLDSQGRVVFSGQENECLYLQLKGQIVVNITDFSFGSFNSFTTDDTRTYLYSEGSLVLKTKEGYEISLQPYQAWE